MAESDDVRPYSLWRRWDTEESASGGEAETLSDTRLFEMCAVLFAGDSIFGDKRDRVVPDNENEPEPVSFLPGVARLLLRHVPTMVFVFLVLVLVEAELRPTTRGVSTITPEIPVVPLIYLSVAGTALLLVLVFSEVIDLQNLVKVIFVYGLFAVLICGSAYGTYLTLSARGESGAETIPHVVSTFPTLLFTLVIGLLSYDLLLRGEYLYTNLDKKNIITAHTKRRADHNNESSDVGSDAGKQNEEQGESNKESYEKIKQDHLIGKLEPQVWQFRYAHFFALLLLLSFLLIWSFNGPLGTGLWSSLLLNITINLIVLVGVFNFLVGILFLRNLLTGNYKQFRLEYLPFHPDKLGGFADIGKLAMRINLIFILIGGYYVYRAYISGIRTYPETTELSFTPLYAEFINIEPTYFLEMVFWSLNFPGPVLLYALMVIIWFYYTFWEIHKQMKKQKKELILKNQIERINEESKPHSVLGENEDRDRKHWNALRDAPEWPINAQKLRGVIAGNIIPMLLSIPTVIPELLGSWP